MKTKLGAILPVTRVSRLSSILNSFINSLCVSFYCSCTPYSVFFLAENLLLSCFMLPIIWFILVYIPSTFSIIPNRALTTHSNEVSGMSSLKKEMSKDIPGWRNNVNIYMSQESGECSGNGEWSCITKAGLNVQLKIRSSLQHVCLGRVVFLKYLNYLSIFNNWEISHYTSGSWFVLKHWDGNSGLVFSAWQYELIRLGCYSAINNCKCSVAQHDKYLFPKQWFNKGVPDWVIFLDALYQVIYQNHRLILFFDCTLF